MRIGGVTAAEDEAVVQSGVRHEGVTRTGGLCRGTGTAPLQALAQRDDNRPSETPGRVEPDPWRV